MFSCFALLRFFKKARQKSMQNRSPEKPSKVDAPETHFGIQNRRKSMPERQKTDKVAKKLVFWSSDFRALFCMRKKHKKHSTKKREGAENLGMRGGSGR